jgi:hypothetical protein
LHQLTFLLSSPTFHLPYLPSFLPAFFPSPSSVKVYIGSFNADAPINKAKNPECVGLFEREHDSLLEDLYEVRGRDG